MNAIELLKTDHQRISGLFELAQQKKDFKGVREVFQEIRKELDIHAYIEETHFYPLFQKRKGFEELVNHSLDEHSEMKELLSELDALGEDSNAFKERLDELQDVVEDHVEDEEEEFFPKVLKELGDEELQQLGMRLAEAKTSMPGASAA